jgi:MoaA/NifB/PqqE/SkfB family radical SAM enzyme
MNRLSERGEIRLGFRCNARCGFCYYQDLLDNPVEKEPTTGQLSDQLRLLRRLGATEVEFTGGEPTIRPDLVDLIRLAKQLGFVNVSIITNGLKIASPRYANDLVNAGANDFLFSIHGPTSEIHDHHTAIPGSFMRILEAVRNIQATGQRCRSTTTVTGKNHRSMEPLLQKLIDLNMECIHLAVFSPVAQAMKADRDMFVSYSDAAASIKRAIDAHRKHLPLLSVKYIPFCFMKGYENYVMNLYQQSYDPDDWNYYYSNKVRRANTWPKRVAFDAIVSAGSLLSKDYSFPFRSGWRDVKVFGLTRLVELLRKKRPAACRTCSYDLVCDHVWKDYAAHFGDAEISPVPGPKITDPVWCYDFAGYRTPGISLSQRKQAHSQSEPRAVACRAAGSAK